VRLNVDKLSFSYDEKLILSEISFSLQGGEILSLLGPNGTGKTTLLKCINRILRIKSGDVRVEEDSILQMSLQELSKKIAYVPQYTNAVFPISVVDTVLMGRTPYACNKYSKKDHDIVFDIIKKMELEKFAFRYINEMSGGERQRVFIARALAQAPKIIILDEPTSSLDLKSQLFILEIISDLAKKNNLSVLMTIHDLNLAAMFSDKIIMLKDAKIFSYGKANAVLTKENIRIMYGVETCVSTEAGYKHVRLLKNIK